MYDLRRTIIIDLKDSICLKEKTTYQFQEKLTGKKLIAKFIAYYDDEYDEYLVAEFRKLALLSGEPEIATVYYLASADLYEKTPQSCYIMDFIDGVNLQEFLNKRDSIIFEVIIDLIHQIASGLEKAHNYEISHGDLHNGNIMIDKYGSVKLIDFLWWDYKLPFEKNLTIDLEDFKRIVDELTEKCKTEDKNRLSIVYNHCKSISNFRGLSKEIQLLNEISFDLSFLEPKSRNILAKLFALVKEYDLDRVLRIEEDKIPDKLLSELTEQENGWIDKIKNDKGLKIRFLDSRIERIQTNVLMVIDGKLNKFKQIGLIDWDSQIVNTGEVFIGPYEASTIIRFNSKFFNWKRINDLLPFVVCSNYELYLLKDD